MEEKEEKELPRYGFLARIVTLTRGVTDSGATPQIPIAGCRAVLINETRMGVAIPSSLAPAESVALYLPGNKFDVCFEPILLHHFGVTVKQWKLKVEVRWVEEVKDTGGGSMWLLGMQFERELPPDLKEWVNYVSGLKPSLPTKTAATTGISDKWEPIFIGLNAIGVACGIIALVWVREPKSARDFLIGIMIATTILYGLYKLHWLGIEWMLKRLFARLGLSKVSGGASGN